MTLVEIARRHETDKGTRHSYLEVYDQLLHGLTAPWMLEIGIGAGGSLRMWRDRFPAGHIIGLDIDPRGPAGGWGDMVGLYPVLGDATNPAVIANLCPDRCLDLVVDDGSHEPRDQLLSLVWCWPKLRPGGLHVIEDVLPGAARHFEVFRPLTLFRYGLRPGVEDDTLVIVRKPIS